MRADRVDVVGGGAPDSVQRFEGAAHLRLPADTMIARVQDRSVLTDDVDVGRAASPHALQLVSPCGSGFSQRTVGAGTATHPPSGASPAARSPRVSIASAAPPVSAGKSAGTSAGTSGGRSAGVSTVVSAARSSGASPAMSGIASATSGPPSGGGGSSGATSRGRSLLASVGGVLADPPQPAADASKTTVITIVWRIEITYRAGYILTAEYSVTCSTTVSVKAGDIGVGTSSTNAGPTSARSRRRRRPSAHLSATRRDTKVAVVPTGGAGRPA